MVRIAEEPEGDPTERLNLDDYNSDDFNEYLSDNMETTPPAITEVQDYQGGFTRSSAGGDRHRPTG